MDVADIPVRNISSLALDFLVEGLEFADVLLHIGSTYLSQLVSHPPCPPLPVPSPRSPASPPTPQSPNLEVGISSQTTNQGLDLAHSVLEPTESGRSNVLARCTSTSELVGGRRYSHGTAAVANAEDPGATFRGKTSRRSPEHQRPPSPQ